MDSVECSIIVPANNEEENLEPLTDELAKVLGGIDYEIILVDDHSSDGTGELCDGLAGKNGRITSIHRSRGDNGMGNALKEGYAAARGRYVIWFMGDRSDEPDMIPEILRELESGYDMVIASRYMEGGSRGDLKLEKAIYGSTYTKLARAIFGIPVHDITNAFRGFKREILDDVELESEDFAISPEFAIKAHMKGLKLGEVPTTYHNRRAGKAKFSTLKMSLRFLSLFKLRLI
ncbi:MAG: glycosyltransferase [Candidatus Altiarchaeales archaeon]|nr:glycosyltransferase [Candidatus Altiarchaeales archaeon]MBD3415642.1 glycosyltransferase [Candidatus Altiarchaeales archaeon]